jgi:hypothetical protein
MRLALILSALLLTPLCSQGVPPAFLAKPPESVEDGGQDSVDSDQEAPQVIHVQVEWIELPHETLTDLLLYHPLKTAAATELRMELQKLVKAGTAKVLETQMVVARSGERGMAESIAEFIYPTEYNETTMAKYEKEGGKLVEVSREVKGRITPTSFETRNIGSTLEIEATLVDSNRNIELRLSPDLTWQTGRTVWQEFKDENGSLIKVEMPEIYSMHTTTVLTLRDGVHGVAAILSPKDQNGRIDLTRKVLIIVKAASLSVR